MTGFEITLPKDTCKNHPLVTVFGSIFFGGIAIFLLLSCVSYLFVGNETININFVEISSFFHNQHYVKNFCGVLGAKAANWVMFYGVGVGAFVIIFFLFFIYCKILDLQFVKDIHIIKMLVLCILAVIYISLVLYYLYENFNDIIAIQNYIGYMTISFGKIFEKYLFNITLPLIIFSSFLFLSLICECIPSQQKYIKKHIYITISELCNI